MWLKLIFLIVTVVNVKAVDNFIDENGQVLLQVPSRNQGSRYFQVQRGPDGEITGLIEVQPSQEPQQALVEKNDDKKEDLVLIGIENKSPPQNEPKENIIIQEMEPVKLPTPSSSRDIFVINEQPIQAQPQPEPDPRPVIFTVPEPAPRTIPQPAIFAPAPKPQPAPNQFVVIPDKQPEPNPNQVVVIPAKQPEPTPSQVVVIPAKQPEPASQVVVIPAKQPEPAPSQVVVLPPARPQPKPIVSYIKTPVQPEPEPRPVVNVINNQLFDYQCRSANGYFALQNQCDEFVECKEFKAYYYECPKGMNFNRNAVWPNYPCSNSWEHRCEVNVFGRSPVISSECPSPYGLYALPDNECSNYIVCHEGIATLMSCPKGLVFNPTLEVCDWLENVPSCRPSVFSGVTCPALHDGDLDLISKYRYGQSCIEYIACHRGAPRLLKCDAGLAFDEQLESCVAANRVQSCSYTII